MNELKKQKRWVVWNLEEVNGRTTKVPYSIRGGRASSTDPKTWATYEQAKKASEFFSGIGIIFTPDEKLLGIDIDHVLDNKKIVGEFSGAIRELLSVADTYTEISPSGTGLHLYLSLTDRLTLGSNRHSPYEAYTSGRFFTFTEESFGSKKSKPIREVTPQEAEALLALIGYPWKKEEPLAMTAGELLTAPRFEDDELVERMMKSKNGDSIRALWDGDASAYKDDLSRADAALLNHLAFWSGKNEEQMERLWLASPLGSREKTQKRADYRTRSIKAAVASTKQVYERPADPLAGLELLMTTTAKGDKVITQNTENICRILRGHADFAATLRHDVFANMFEIKEGEVWRAFEDVDALHIQSKIAILFPFFQKVSKDMVYDAILKVLNENAYDSAIEYVTSMEWDGTPRLDQWLTHTYGTPDDVYHRAVASNWFKGLVKRIVEPGCKFDYVLVLEGAQGVKKSTSLHILGELPNGRSMHVETTMSTDSKDFFMQFAGKAIVEFSEGETLSRTEVKKMKAIITMQSDKYRPPYSRVSQDFPRRCVFAMTTNQDEYLKDETGNRRWLPIRVILPKANVEWLAENKEQLYAEAHHRVTTLKETLYEFPEEETLAQQEARRVSDPNEERIAEWYYSQFVSDNMREEGITIQQAYYGALGGIGQTMRKHEEMAIADVLARVLRLTKRRKMVNGIQSMRWFNDNAIRFDQLGNDLEPVTINAANIGKIVGDVKDKLERVKKKIERADPLAGEFDDDDLPFKT